MLEGENIEGTCECKCGHLLGDHTVGGWCAECDCPEFDYVGWDEGKGAEACVLDESITSLDAMLTPPPPSDREIWLALVEIGKKHSHSEAD